MKAAYTTKERSAAANFSVSPPSLIIQQICCQKVNSVIVAPGKTVAWSTDAALRKSGWSPEYVPRSCKCGRVLFVERSGHWELSWEG